MQNPFENYLKIKCPSTGDWNTIQFLSKLKIDCQSSHTSLIQSQKRNNTSNRSKHQRAWHMSAAGPKTSLLCKQSAYRDPKRIHCHRNQIASCSLGDGKISSFPVCKSLHPRNGSKTIRGHITQEPEPSNTQAAKNPDKNFPLQFHCALYTRSSKSTCGLLVPNGRSRRHH